MTLKAHFDGRVFVPDQPVNMATDCAVELEVHEVEPATSRIGFDQSTGLPVVKVSPNSRTIAMEDVHRWENEL
jgi:hypothetical protein